MPVVQLAKCLPSLQCDGFSKCCRAPLWVPFPALHKPSVAPHTVSVIQTFKGGGRRIRSLRSSLAT